MDRKDLKLKKIPMPHGESHSNPQENFAPLLIPKKITPQGPKWVARHEMQAKMEEITNKTGTLSSREIFGFKLLSSWEFLNQKGAIWDLLQEVGTPEDIKKSVPKIQKRKFNIELKKMYENLGFLAENNPHALKYLFLSYLKSGVDKIDIEHAVLSKKE